MTRDEKIAAAKEAVVAAAKLHAADHPTALPLDRALLALAEAEKPERPRLMAPRERASRHVRDGRTQIEAATFAVDDDRADILEKVIAIVNAPSGIITRDMIDYGASLKIGAMDGPDTHALAQLTVMANKGDRKRIIDALRDLLEGK